MNRRQAILLLSLGFVGACARGVTVGSSAPGSTNYVSVTNSTGTAMDVYFNDGSDHMLGSLVAGKTDRFIIVSPKTTMVSISGRAQTGTRSSGPYQLSLGGTTSKVTLK